MEKPSENLGANYLAAMERYSDLMEKDCNKKIGWDVLKEAFLKECTKNGEIATHPLLIFQWFQNEIKEYLK